MSQKLFKFKPFSFEEIKYPERIKVPKPRSGHRIVSTDYEIYSFGGYNPEINEEDEEMMSDSEWLKTKPLFREFWRFSFITREWTRLPICDNTPQELASNCVTLIEDKYLFVFGGTGFPFGHSSSNKIFVANLLTNEWKQIECNNSDENECPIAQYGQALTRDDSNNFYVIGGTTGFDYTIDVHKFDLKTRLWHHLYRKSNHHYKEFPEERYRHEIVLFDNKLFAIGGGTSTQCFSIQKIPVFDLQTKEWTEVQTINDLSSLSEESDGYPSPRKCHDCVLIDDSVFVLGGIKGRKVFDDLWKLDLKSLQWTQLSVKIPRALYFHSAALSSTGRLSIFGGVTNPVRHNNRTNQLFTVWLKIPALKEMAFEAVLHYIDRSKPINETFLNLELPPNFRQRIKQNYQLINH